MRSVLNAIFDRFPEIKKYSVGSDKEVRVTLTGEVSELKQEEIRVFFRVYGFSTIFEKSFWQRLGESLERTYRDALFPPHI